METREKNRISVAAWWRLCPVRHSLLLLSLAWVGVYFATRENKRWMQFLSGTLVRPWHRLAGRIYSLVPFSAAEWIIALWIGLGLCFLVQLVIHIRRRHSGEALYRWVVSILAMATTLFGLFSLWWGVFYYSGTFAETSGLERRAISSEELRSVTAWFADMANEYSDQVERDERGVFTADRRDLFDRSRTLYHGIEKVFPELEGPELRAKPVVFSRIMSLMNNTGFFFPYTAEANLNVDCPTALLPATIAHELAHQRGVAREDEANFVAVAACLADGDAEYVYSGALMAYIYLGNALHSTDYAAWEEVYRSLNEDVRRDLDDHNAYWARFDTKVAEVSDKVYEVFLETYGDDRGMKSYDACVDLLTLYYLNKAVP